MKILYVNRGASPSKFSEYLKKYDNKLQQQGQKYNQLLMEGLVEGASSVISLSTRPIGRMHTSQKYFKGERECENGIEYRYIPFFNMKLLRELSVFAGIFFSILFAKGKKKEVFVICDALNIAASAAVVIAAALRGFRTMGIVTDVPCHLSYIKNVSFSQKLNLKIMQKFKSYLLLTEQMSEIVNPKNRPYVVLEGHSDISMKDVENRLEEKSPQKVCLYAGSLMKIYGIESLVRGFVNADIPDTELHIYGDGDFKKELEELSGEYPSVKYLGIAPNSEIVKAELKATLLVNPRPTHEEYTKYSFPSKNMEYMASGTPVLTTKLPGMPKEYDEFVYLIEEETADGIKKALSEILKLDKEVLHEKGLLAKEFVMNRKNNCVQAKKVLDMINEVIN